MERSVFVSDYGGILVCKFKLCISNVCCHSLAVKCVNQYILLLMNLTVKSQTAYLRRGVNAIRLLSGIYTSGSYIQAFEDGLLPYYVARRFYNRKTLQFTPLRL